MSIVHHPAIPDNATLTSIDLEWLDGYGEPDFSDLDPSGQPAVITIVAVEAADHLAGAGKMIEPAAPRSYGEPLSLADWIDGEARRFTGRFPAWDAAVEPLAAHTERACDDFDMFVGLELHGLARTIRFHRSRTVVGHCKATRIDLADLDALPFPHSIERVWPLARRLYDAASFYLSPEFEDSDAAKLVARQIVMLAEEANLLESGSVAEYYIDEAAFRAAAIDAVMGARVDDLAALGL